MSTKALNNLPLKKLIGDPLSAAAQAHLELTDANLEALKTYVVAGNIEFDFKYMDDADTNKTVTLNLPVMALVNLPLFSIDSLVNEFTFEVSTIQDQTEATDGNLRGSVSAGGFFSKFVDFNVEGGYTKKSSIQSTNSEKGKLHIRVEASRTGPTEALKMIMEAATKAITVKEI